LNVPIYEQSVNLGDIILVRWRRHLANFSEWHGHCTLWAWSHENRRNW